MEPLAQNQSCDPYTPQSRPCQLGNYADYAINVTSSAHIAAGVKFAQENNIRLVIKSTGHDLLGKSTGRGSLGLWVHNLDTIQFSNYTSSIYNGPAVKLGPGVQSWQVDEAADPYSLRVLTGGTCPTVAVGGGYSQGGGHSLLSSKYGLSADNVLEWEVVLANGSHIVATPAAYPDLYWALSGGGGSTYAVVISMTVKAFPESSTGISAAAITYTSDGISEDTFWAGVTAFHNHFPTWVDAGGVVAYSILNNFFYLRPLTLPDKTLEETKALIDPFTAELDELGIPYVLNVTNYPTFLELFGEFYGPLPYGIYGSAQVQGGRLIPRSLITSNRTADLVSVFRNITASGDFMMIGVGVNVSQTPVAPNALNPYWRQTVVHNTIQSTWNFSLSWDSQLEKEDLVTNTWVPALENLTPGNTATYLNEGDPHQPNWKSAYYGPNYDKLRSIKAKYDPNSVFYAPTGVGSDEWIVGSDGRLCTANTVVHRLTHVPT